MCVATPSPVRAQHSVGHPLGPLGPAAVGLRRSDAVLLVHVESRREAADADSIGAAAVKDLLARGLRLATVEVVSEVAAAIALRVASLPCF